MPDDDDDDDVDDKYTEKAVAQTKKVCMINARHKQHAHRTSRIHYARVPIITS